jgi:hypothetical protein
MARWEALLGIVTATTLFVPIFVTMFAAHSMEAQRRAARERRITQYRKSPDSRLLILNDRTPL